MAERPPTPPSPGTGSWFGALDDASNTVWPASVQSAEAPASSDKAEPPKGAPQWPSFHRVHRVEEQVHQDLFQPHPPSPHLHRPFGPDQPRRHPDSPRARLHQIKRAFHHLNRVDVLKQPLFLTREGFEVFGRALHPPDQIARRLDAGRGFGRGRLQGHFRRGQTGLHRSQGLADLMDNCR